MGEPPKETLYTLLVGQKRENKISAYLPDARCVQETTGGVTLRVANQFSKEWLHERYFSQVASALRARGIQTPKIEIIVDKAVQDYFTKSPSETLLFSDQKRRLSLSFSYAQVPSPKELKEIVVTETNYPAFKAARELLYRCLIKEAPASPPCIFGPKGEGKSSLLGMVMRNLLQQNRSAGYINVGGLSQYYQAHKGMGPDLTHLFSSSLFVIDGLEELINIHSVEHTQRPGTQKRVWSIIDFAKKNRRHLFLASTKSPEQLARVVEHSELSTFLKEVTISQVDPLDGDFKDYLSSRLSLENLTDSKAELSFAAEYLHSLFDESPSRREIEAKVTTLSGYARYHHLHLTRGVMQKALGHSVQTRIWDYRMVDPHKILETFSAQLFPELKLSDIRGNSRIKSLRDARVALAWAIKNTQPDISLERIGSLFGGRDHSTVLNALKRAEYFSPDEKARIIRISERALASLPAPDYTPEK